MDRLQLANEVIEPSKLDYLAIPGVIPGTPQLTIGTAVSVSWPIGGTGFVLQSSTTLSEPKVWTPVSIPPIVQGDTFYALLPTTEVETFYGCSGPMRPEEGPPGLTYFGIKLPSGARRKASRSAKSPTLSPVSKPSGIRERPVERSSRS